MMRKILLCLLTSLFLLLPVLVILGGGVEKNCRDLDDCRDSSDGCVAFAWRGCTIYCDSDIISTIPCHKGGGGSGGGRPGPQE